MRWFAARQSRRRTCLGTGDRRWRQRRNHDQGHRGDRREGGQAGCEQQRLRHRPVQVPADLMMVHGRCYRRLPGDWQVLQECPARTPQWFLGAYSMYMANFYVEYPLYQPSTWRSRSSSSGSLTRTSHLGTYRLPELYQDGSVFGIHFSHDLSWMFSDLVSSCASLSRCGPWGRPTGILWSTRRGATRISGRSGP